MMNQQLFPVFARSKRTNLGPDYPLYRARYEHIPPSVRCHPQRPRDFTKRSDGLRTARPPGGTASVAPLQELDGAPPLDQPLVRLRCRVGVAPADRAEPG